MKRFSALILGLLAFAVILGCLGGGGGSGVSPTVPGGASAGVNGRIYFPDRQLYGGITVQARNVSGQSIASVQTDQTGNFAFSDLPGGIYDLVALAGDAEVTFASSLQVAEGAGTSIPVTPLLSLQEVKLDTVTSGSVHLAFRTNLACISHLDYGTAIETPRTQAIRSDPGISHDAVISGLQSNTRYVFTLRLRGNDGQVFRYYGLFTTTANIIGPSRLGISINEGQFETRNANVILTLSVEGATQMRVGDAEELGDQPWETFLPSRDYALSAGDGTKRVYVQFRDGNGNLSPVISDSILLSTSRSGYIGVWIENGAAVTSKTDCVLTLVYPGATQMRISDGPDFVNSFWETFSEYRKWKLGTGDGTKRVYVQFRGGTANPQETFSSSIVLDTTGTGIVMKINGGAAKTNNSLVTITFTTTKSPYQMQVNNGSADFSSSEWVSYSQTVVWSLDWNKSEDDGRKTVYARFKDSQGEIFGPVGESIIIDTIPPQNPTLSIDVGTSTTSLNVRLLMSADGAQNMILSNSEDFVGASIEPFRSAKSWVLGGYGRQSVFARYYDDASNSTNLLIFNIEVLAPRAASDSILINGGDLSTDRINAQLTLFSGSAVRMRVSQNANFTNQPDLAYTASMPFTLGRPAGRQMVAVRFENASGEFSIASDTIEVIGPSSSTISILDPQPVTSLAVQARPFAIDAVQMLLTENYSDLGNDALLEDYATDRVFYLQPFIGWHTIYAKYRNAGGVDTVPVSMNVQATGSAVVAMAPPSVIINDGDAGTSQTGVTLTLDSRYSRVNIDQVWITNDGNFTAVTPRTYVNQISDWQLDPVEGNKTVSVRFSTASGTFVAASDSITLIGPASPTVSTLDSQPITRGLVNLDLFAVGASSMVVSVDQNDMYNPTWETFTRTKTFALPSGRSSVRVYARFRNAGGVWSQIATLDLTVNSAAPTGSSAVFRAGVTPASTQVSQVGVGSLPVYIHFVTDTLTASVAWALTTPDQAYPAWPGSFTIAAAPLQAIAVSRTTTPSVGEGQNTLWTRFSNGFGIWTDLAAVPLEVVPWPGSAMSIAINGGDASTDRRDLRISVSAPDQSLMWLSNDGNFNAATAIVPPTAPAMATWYLAAPTRAGTKTVYARFQNAAGTYSYASDTILAVGPASATISTGDAQPLNSSFVNLNLFADGATDMFLTEDPASVSAAIVSWQSYQGSYVFSPLKPGLSQHTIYARFRNSYGANAIEAQPVSLTVTSRSTAPSGNTATLRASAALSSDEATSVPIGSMPIYLHFTINDAGTASVSYAIASAGGGLPATFRTVPAPPAPLPLYPGDFPGYGPFNVWYKFSDNLGNTTAVQALPVEILGPSVKISPAAPAALNSAESQQFTATLKNTTGSVVWKLYDPAGNTPAVPASTYGTLDTLNGKFTAPTTVRIATYATVYAELQGDTTVKDEVRVYLNPQVEVKPAVTQVSAKYNETKNFAVVFENTTSGGTVVSSPAGYFPALGISAAVPSVPETDAIATVTFTAGSGPPSQNPVILTITSSADPAKSKTVSVDLRSGDYIQLNPASASVRLRTGKLIITADASTPTTVNWSATAGTVSPAATTGPHQITFSAPSSGGVAYVTASPSAAIGYQATVTVTLTPAVKVTVSPGTVVSSVATTTPLQFYAQLENATTSQVVWEYINLASWSPTANWVTAGVATVPSIGFLASNAVYTPPTELPMTVGYGSDSVLVRATSVDDPSASATARIDLKEPLWVKIRQGYSAADPLLTMATSTLEIGQIQMFGEVGPPALVNNYTVTWKVEEITGGNTSYGTIDGNGLYQAPDARVKSPITVKAVSNQDPTRFASASINLQDFWTARSENLKDVTNATFSIYTVMVDPTTASPADKILFVGTNGNGVWKATVPAGSWSSVPWAATGLATTGAGVGGRMVVNGLSMSRQNPGRIVAATADGLYCSNDGGTTFGALALPGLRAGYESPISPFPQISYTSIFSAVAVDPTDDTYLYAAGKNQGVVRYTWNGATYTYSGTLWDDQARLSYVYYADRNWVDASGTVRTYQEPMRGDTASGTIQMNCIAIDSQNPNVLYVGYSGHLDSRSPDTPVNGYIKFNAARTSSFVTVGTLGVAYTGDPNPALGATKTLNGYAFNTSQAIRKSNLGGTIGLTLAMAVDPNTPTTLWAGKNDGIYRSTDDGNSWNGLGTYVNVRHVLIDPINTINVYIGTESGLYRSANAGSTWKQIKSGLEGHTTINGFGLSPGGWGSRRIFSGTTAGVYMGVTTLDF